MENERQTAEERQLPQIIPATDILEKPDGFHIFMDLPGVDKADLSIDLNEDEITIRAQGRQQSRGEARITHSEFCACEYSRTLTLSSVVDRGRIKAVLRNGVLDLFLPKAEEAKPRRIEIQAV